MAFVLEPGKTYTVQVTATNRSMVAGIPVEAVLGVGLRGKFGRMDLFPETVQTEDFQPEETRTVSFTVDIPNVEGAGNLAAWIQDPTGHKLAEASADVWIGPPPDPLEIVDGWWTPVNVSFGEPFWRTVIAPKCTVVIKNNSVYLDPVEQQNSILAGSIIMPLLKPYRTPWGNWNQFAFGPYDFPGLPAIGEQKEISIAPANTDLLNLLDNGYVTTEYEGIAAMYVLLIYWQYRGITTKVVELRRV